MEKTETEAVAALARAAAGVPAIVKNEEGREFLIVPTGHQHIEVTSPHGPPAKKPAFLKQGVTLQAVESLVEYVNRFKSGDTVLFADIDQSSIAAALDYHGAPDKAAHFAHRATMQLPFSEEYRTWKAIDGKLMPQLDFARFIEENAAEIVAPSGAELLEAVRDLQARRSVNFIKAVRTASDNECFEYADNTEARSKGDLELPTKFRLGLPIYFGEPPAELYAFLRWKLDDGSLTLGVKMHRLELVRQAVFKAIVMRVGDETGCPVVFGKAA